MSANQASTQTTLVDGPSPVALTSRYDYDGSGNLIYQGWAYSSNPANASAPDAAKPMWVIVRYTYNGSSQLTVKEWAGGTSDFSYVWNNRAALSYQ